MIIWIADKDLIVLVDSHSCRPIKLANITPTFSETEHEIARWAEHLNAIITKIRYNNMTLTVDSNMGRAIKITSSISQVTKARNKLTIFIIDNNSCIAAVNDDYIPIFVYSNSTRVM